MMNAVITANGPISLTADGIVVVASKDTHVRHSGRERERERERERKRKMKGRHKLVRYAACFRDQNKTGKRIKSVEKEHQWEKHTPRYLIGFSWW